jgi:hypothetical protein
MSKKSRRARKSPSRRSPRSATPAQPEEAVEPATEGAEYAYVVADIKQVAILAAAMFVLLIVLSFFIG